ncbi:MAG TPA: hypothetical protein VI776_01595 [Anaerolineales bacterium]|nr:hypothetical protein [Anaerolineales bacterium]
MNWRWLAFLFLIGLGVGLLVAASQDAPGYMDADYYYAGGMRLASGQGWSEPFLWNYLDDPLGLPHPAFTYWMPLASLLAAMGMRLAGSTSFDSAQAIPVLLAALLPPLTAWLAFSLTQQRWAALLAGLLALLPGFYLPFQVTTDTFAVSMILGIAWLQLLKTHADVTGFTKILQVALGLGLTAGLMHLARAEGLVWLGITLLAVWCEGRRFARSRLETAEGRRAEGRRATDGRATVGLRASLYIVPGMATMACLLGYLLVMGGWLARNLALYGTLLSPAGGKVFWITGYDEIFVYPASILTSGRWWSSGLDEILRARLWALGQNLQTVIAVQGEIFLALLIVPGVWAFRKDVRVRWGLLAFVVMFLLMTLVFPYPGGRGGLFHSGATLQPLWWALAPAGLQAWLLWGQKKRGWQVKSARQVFTAGVVGLALLVTGLTGYTRLQGADPTSPAWGSSKVLYQRLEGELEGEGIPPEAIVMVNNPPGYYSATGRSAIPVPIGGQAETLAAAQRYKAGYLLLERNHPGGLDSLYQKPADRSGLRYLSTVDGAHLFEILGER